MLRKSTSRTKKRLRSTSRSIRSNKPATVSSPVVQDGRYNLLHNRLHRSQALFALRVQDLLTTHASRSATLRNKLRTANPLEAEALTCASASRTPAKLLKRSMVGSLNVLLNTSKMSKNS